MSLAHVARLLSNLPRNSLAQYPTGRWGFVGSVRADLCYKRPDGEPLTGENVAEIRQFGPRLAGVTGVSFETREDALTALAREFSP